MLPITQLAGILSSNTSLPASIGLVASYNMDESGGTTLIDRSGNGRNGTLINSPTWGAGNYNGGLTFSATNKVDLANQLPILDIPQLTISVWVKRTSLGSAIEIGRQSANGDAGISIELWTDGNVYFGLSVGGEYGTCALNDTNWHFISMVFDGNQTGNANRLKGYVDGVQQTLTFVGTIPARTTSATDSFGIGSLNSKYSNGCIDDVRIYDRPLLMSEVVSDMSTPVTNTITPPAIPYTKLEERMQLFHDGALRGFTLAPLPNTGIEPYSETDLQNLVDTGANVVRVPIHLQKAMDGMSYTTPEADISYVEHILDLGALYGFRVIVVLQQFPFGDNSDHWNDNDLKADIVSKWTLIATRLKKYRALQAYDLLNEPVIPGSERVSGLNTWHDFAVTLGQAIQAVDSNTPLMFEPAPWGLPGSFWQAPSLNLLGVVYSFHLYSPHAFTQQGLPGYTATYSYPGNGWDSNFLYLEMLEARNIASAHNVPMFVGEFSCVRWATGTSSQQWLADAMTLFATENWGWTYHVWRNYHGWDSEIPSNVSAIQSEGILPQYRTANSASLVLLKNEMAGNQHFQ